ncbi:hypothetical protein V6K52_05980 [Knoellia sp. S7-12]|uniref:hypothetical protein n=1 Tax=Knoellia sp. S7-12 TaxID=3126698 RepID=UPI0033699434
MGKRTRHEGVWIGSGEWGVPQWTAILAVLVCGVSAVISASSLFSSDDPIAESGAFLMFLGGAVVFLPTAVLGRRRPPGVRTLAMGLLLFAASGAAVVFAARFEPNAFIFDGRRGQIMRSTAPVLALAFLAAGGYLLRLSFRRIEPTDHEARHAEDS